MNIHGIDGWGVLKNPKESDVRCQTFAKKKGYVFPLLILPPSPSPQDQNIDRHHLCHSDSVHTTAPYLGLPAAVPRRKRKSRSHILYLVNVTCSRVCSRSARNEKQPVEVPSHHILKMESVKETMNSANGSAAVSIRSGAKFYKSRASPNSRLTVFNHLNVTIQKGEM